MLGAVMVHHLWDAAGEQAAAPVQGVAVLLCLRNNDVNTTLRHTGGHKPADLTHLLSSQLTGSKAFKTNFQSLNGDK